MAYVAPNTLNRVSLKRGRFGMGGSFNQKQFNVAASQTIKAGDILKFTGGAGVITVEQSITAPSALSATLSGGNAVTLGIALNSVTSNSSGVDTSSNLQAVVNVAILDASLEIGLRIYNATAANAELQDLTLGTTYQYARYTDANSDSFYCLSTTTTNGELVYVEPYEGSAAGDDYGVAWCRIAISETIQQD